MITAEAGFVRSTEGETMRRLLVLTLIAAGAAVVPIAPASAVDPPDPPQCEPGTFSATGSAPCDPAPAGRFVATPGATEATPCPVGTFSDFMGAVACTLAPVGFYVDTFGAIEATACPEGQTTAWAGSISEDACFLIETETDTDGDGVADVDDICPGTVLPDTPTKKLKKNRFAASDLGFASVDGVVVASLADTGGCSGTQIIAAAGLGAGHSKFGISRGALRAWIDTLDD